MKKSVTGMKAIDVKEMLIKAAGIVSPRENAFDAAAKLTEWGVKRFDQRFLKNRHHSN